MAASTQLAILGGGNIGTAMARGLVEAGRLAAPEIIVTRRRPHLLDGLARQGYVVQADNRDAVRRAGTVIIAVTPQQLTDLLRDIRSELDPERHVVISVVSGVGVAQISRHLGADIPVVRAMPNTAIAIQESITCLAAPPERRAALETARSLFDAVGATLVIHEEQMVPATALCACGIAFFLRAIRAASQGGIEIGFDSAEALTMAAQTAKGAAALLLSLENHPEMEIDKVTTPRGCTIAGLNAMEHHGFSSALIRGIVTSAVKAGDLFTEQNGG